MPIVQLPDGKKLNYNHSITGLEIAKDISISLSKNALALEINGEYKENSLVKEVTNFILKDKKRPICIPLIKK